MRPTDPRLLLGLCALLALASCSCGGPVPPNAGGSGDAAGTTGALAGAKRDWAANPAIVVLAGVTDIYAMGDVHGDPEAQMRTLVGAGLAAPGHPPVWTGGKATLIVTGDVIDKGDRSLPAIDTFIALEADAAAKGGRVVVTSGNHEAEFLADPGGKKAKEFRKELKKDGQDPEDVASGKGKYGQWLHSRPYGVLAGEWFFSHAGDAAGPDGAPRSAKDLGAWFEKSFEAGQWDAIAEDNLLQGRKDWWWDAASGRSILDDVLAALPAKHLVYGHQPGNIPCPPRPQDERVKQTLFTCYDGKVFFLDVGMSRAVDPDSTGGLLHIELGPSPKVTALYPSLQPRKLWPSAN